MVMPINKFSADRARAHSTTIAKGVEPGNLAQASGALFKRKASTHISPKRYTTSGTKGFAQGLASMAPANVKLVAEALDAIQKCTKAIQVKPDRTFSTVLRDAMARDDIRKGRK